jgi:hypothetical protein
MSISAISSSLFQPSITQSVQNKFQQIQSEFQQLGQDLQAGNLSQAQQDFVTLTQNLPGGQQQNASGGRWRKRLTYSRRISRREISRRRRKTSPPFNRTSRSPGRYNITTIIAPVTPRTPVLLPGRKAIRSRRLFKRWGRRCNPEVCRPPSRRMPRCSRICSNCWRRSARDRAAMAARRLR